MSNINRIRKYYGTMDKGEKAYMANKLFKDDNVVAAKVKEFIPDELLYPKVEVTYKTGSRFKVAGENYILAQVGHAELALVCLTDGNRWAESVDVDNPQKVTEDEMSQITNDNPFIKVGALNV